MSRGRALQAGLLLGLGLLVLLGLLQAVAPDRVVAALRHASPRWMALGLLGPVGFVILRGWRWRVILGASSPHVTLGDVIAITGVGFAVNAVAAFKLGDLVRLGAMAGRARIGVGEAGATIVVERVLDVLALIVLAVVAAAASGSGGASSQLWGGVVAFALVSLALGAALAWLVSREDWTLGQWSRLCARLPPRLGGVALVVGTSALRGLRSLRSGGRLALAGALSLAVWAVSIGGLYAFFRAFSPQLSPATLLLAAALFTLTQAVSVTPGSVGTYEGLYFLVLTAFGARPHPLVAAAAVLSHAGGVAGLLACGAGGSLWLRLRGAGDPVRLKRPLAREDSA
jgi:uncharacterized membrane protein YbhN (UPF0104 family)